VRLDVNVIPTELTSLRAKRSNPCSVIPGSVFRAPPRNDVPKTFFIIFVDAIFTTLFERPFTNVFDVMAQTPAPACVYPARTTG
jgi:hypothetical protein